MRGSTFRKGARWYARHDGPPTADGKRQQVYVRGRFATQKDAQAALNDALARVGAGTWIAPDHSTTAEYLARWLDHKTRTCRVRTTGRYAELIATHINPAIGNVRLTDVRPLHVQHLLDNAKRADGKAELSATTVRHIFRVVKMAFRQAVRWQLIAVNPADAIDPPKAERPDTARVGQDVALALLDAARGTPLEVPVTLGLGAGLRRGEAFGLRWSDVDFEASLLRIRQTLHVGGIFTEPKTDRSRREVAVPAFVVATLKRHRSEQLERRLALGEAWQDNGLVLERGDGRPADLTAVTHAFKKLARSLGYPELRFHDTRHGYATVSLAAGVPLKVISDQLGHSTYAITADIYAYSVPEVRTDAATRLEGMLGQA